MAMMAIPGKSGQEGQIVEFTRDRLRKAGVPAAAITTDQVHRKTPLAGEIGNLICKLPGTRRGPRRMLVGHVDTVPLCVGSKPVLRGRLVQSADKTTGLGADNRAGAAVLLASALEIVSRDLSHPPLTFFWPVQEEVGLHGARLVALSQLGSPRLAFNFDGGAPDKLTVGATGAYRISIDVFGLASHAGGAPEAGVSAVTIAALGIADLHAGGWLGDVQKNGHHGTSNVGHVTGGGATNVVTDHVQLKAEARSHNAAFRRRMLKEIESAFRRAAAAVQNVEGRPGKAKIESRLDYDAFRLADDEPCVLAAESAVRSIGLEPLRAIANGGVDANWLTARGIPTVTLGCGQMNVHTANERLDVDRFLQSCRIGLRLATASEE